MLRQFAAGAAAVALSVAFAACGDDDPSEPSSEGEGGGKTVTVYSSLPLQGAQRPQTTDMVKGIELALEQAGGKAGDMTVKYESLDDSTAQAGAWTPEATTANARQVAQDDSAAVYIGEFNSGASAVSIPILNEIGVPQISPANTAVGLTSDEPGAGPGEPNKYYPSGQRTYTRIVPKDTIQGAALATLMKEDGCTKVFMTNDKEVYGAGLANNIQAAAEAQGLEIVANEPVDKGQPNYRSVAQAAAGEDADCFVYSGITANNAVQLYKDFAAALPDAKLYGPDGVAETGFTDPKEGGIPANVADRVKLTRRDAVAGRVPARGPGVLQPVPGDVRRAQPEPVRDLRLRGDAPRARRDRALRHRRQGRRAGRAVRDEGPRERARHLLDRRERGHHADRLRGLHRQGRRARVRPDDQGAAGVVIRRPFRYSPVDQRKGVVQS